MSYRFKKKELEEIAYKVYEEAYGKDIELSVKESQEFALSLYNDYYPEEIRKKMNSLPEGWLPQISQVYIQSKDKESGYMNWKFINMGKPLPVLTVDARYSSCLRIENTTDELKYKVKELDDKQTDLFFRVKNEVVNAVNIYKTSKQMSEGFPEAYQIALKLYPNIEQVKGGVLTKVPEDLIKRLKSLPEE